MPGARTTKHQFGGPWTEIKLDAINHYLQFYQGALKNMGFETWYVDAFAGTGERHAKVVTGGLFEALPVAHEERVLDGSARKALQINPPFAHYWFAEMHQGRQRALAALRNEFPHDIRVYPGDANRGLEELFGNAPWASGPTSWKQRAVVFLDPYGMSVGFDTLRMLADTKRVDVWYLFPRAAVTQQLARDIRGVDENKRASLAKIFGCEDWEDRLYRSQPAQGSLFGEPIVQTKLRPPGSAEVATFARERFDKLFGYVSKPLPLLINGNDFFELYCLSNNPNAYGLITKGVNHVLRKFTPQSRRWQSDIPVP